FLMSPYFHHLHLYSFLHYFLYAPARSAFFFLSLHDALPILLACGADVVDLIVLGELVLDLAIPVLDLTAQLLLIDLWLIRSDQLVHLLDQAAEVVGDHPVLTVVHERLHGDLHARAKLGEQLLHALVRQVWVLLGAGEDELLGSDGLVEDEPAISHPGAPNMAQRREVIAARDEVIGQPLARRVQPHRAGTRDDANTVARPNGVPVVHALRVVPGPVGVHEVRTRSFGDADHAAVHVGRHAGDHVLRGGPPAVSRPALAHQVEVSANSAGSDYGA